MHCQCLFLFRVVLDRFHIPPPKKLSFWEIPCTQESTESQKRLSRNLPPTSYGTLLPPKPFYLKKILAHKNSQKVRKLKQDFAMNILWQAPWFFHSFPGMFGTGSLPFPRLERHPPPPPPPHQQASIFRSSVLSLSLSFSPFPPPSPFSVTLLCHLRFTS